MDYSASLSPELDERIDYLFKLYSPVDTYCIIMDEFTVEFYGKGLATSVPMLPAWHKSMFSSNDIDYKLRALKTLWKADDARLNHRIASYAVFVSPVVTKAEARLHKVLYGATLLTSYYVDIHKHFPVNQRAFVEKYLKYGAARALSSGTM